MDTKNSIRSEIEVAHIFRRLQILTQEYNYFYGCILQQGQQVLVLITGISGCYGTIKFIGQMPFLAYVIFPLAAVTSITVFNLLYPFKGLIPRGTVEFKQSWRWNMHQSAEFKRFLVSCREIQITVGSFFNYGRNTSLEVTRIAMNNTINLLISWN